MASNFKNAYKEENTNFSRMCRTVVELCRDALWDILVQEIPATDLPAAVVTNKAKGHRLHSDIMSKFEEYHANNKTPIATDVDVTALYTLIRNLVPRSKLKPPTNGWNKPPGPQHIKVGDDIERVHQYRNLLYGHVTEASIPEKEFLDYSNDLKAIFKRFDGQLGTSFERVFNNYLSCEIDPKAVEEYKDLLMKQKEYDEETRSMVAKTNDLIELTEQKVQNLTEDVESNKGGINQLRVATDATGERVAALDKCQRRTNDMCEELKLTQDKQAEHQETFQADVLSNSRRIETLKQEQKSGKPNITISVKPEIYVGDGGAKPKSKTLTIERENENIKVKASLSSHDHDQPMVRQPKSYSEALCFGKDHQIKRKMDNSNTRHQINLNVSQTVVSENLQTPVKTQYAILEKAVNAFKDGHYVLICSKLHRHKYMESIGLVPWTVVFDLDPSGRTSGLLSAIEEKLHISRSLYVHSLYDKITNITESSTHWFAIGTRPDSDASSAQDFSTWNKNPKVSQGIKSIINNMKSFSDTYTRYRIIVLWPPDDDSPRYVERILSKLEKHFEPQVIVIDSNGDKTPYSSSILINFTKDLQSRLSIIHLTMEDVCSYINHSLYFEGNHKERKFILPVSKVAVDCQIDQRQASWLKEILEILYEDKQYDASNITAKELKKEIDNFYRGGTLPWFVRYEHGSDNVDTERDLMKPVIKLIREWKEVYRSGIIKLNHAPGSGGTTLAQRILWGCREMMPCAQINLRDGYMLNEVEQRLELLYKKTDLPLLILFDGEDEHRICDLMKSLEHISLIILAVNRYPYRMTNTGFSNGEYWLDSYISLKESNGIALKLGNLCETKTKKESIGKLNDAVKDKKQIAIFEFGLAAFTYEYAGIASYVSGFLRLDQTEDELMPWQTALTMLSFAYFYGQMGIPCEFFTDYLQLGMNKVPNIDDFPKEMQALIVRETTYRKQNVIRISHYFIAKEILEQVLPWPKSRSKIRSERLCLEDKRDLEHFAIKFIQRAEKVDNRKSGHAILSMLTKSFISRDSKEAQKAKTTEKQKEKKKNIFSPLLSDLENKAPHTSKFNVYSQLIKSFPKEPPFHAQLGRLYTILKPEMEEYAERHFKRALELCEERKGSKSLEELPRSMRLTLMMTNHMYGRMFKTRVEKFTGKHATYKPTLPTAPKEFPSVAQRLLREVKSACERFEQCRYYTPSNDQDNNAIGEDISIRLQFCEFVSRNGKSENVSKFIEQNERSKLYREICDFLKECMYEIDSLFLEYFSGLSDPDDIDPNIQTYQAWYTALFKKSSPGYITKQDDSMQGRRLYIAQLKINTGERDGYGDLLRITKLEEILSIITSYESNFEDYHKRGQKCPKKTIDLDYREWMVAIRHKMIPVAKSVEDVLQIVGHWYKTLNTPTSRLYVFILKSILGFGTSWYQGNTRLLLEAKDLRSQLSSQAKYISNARRPREWLGEDEGIRCLELGSRYSGEKDRTIDPSHLVLFRGTISYPNRNPRSGSIDIDLGRGNSVDVKAFFVPLRANMAGPSFAGRRVEFNIAFSFMNGYEAFFTTELKRVKCPKCKLGTEATSRDREIQCPIPCGNTFYIE